MPELPEVETVRRGAEPLLRSRSVQSVELRRADLRWPIPVAAVTALVGRQLLGAERRSKYLLLRFGGDGRPVVLIHLGMSGRLLVEPIAPDAERPPWRLHEHWRFDFGDRVVRFVDPRRFGALDVVREKDLATHPLLAQLGIEPLHAAFDGAWLFAKTRGKRASVKSTLMNAGIVVGIGNIYASEACWRARVRPRRAAGSLTRAECGALVAAVKTVLQAAIDAGGTSFRDYVGVGEEQGFFARELAVYERAGERCRRCGERIRQTCDHGRSTYWCSGCQR